MRRRLSAVRGKEVYIGIGGRNGRCFPGAVRVAEPGIGWREERSEK
jgi:hypothetical protein